MATNSNALPTPDSGLPLPKSAPLDSEAPIKDIEPNVGLVANGSSAGWHIDIDETLDGPEKLFVQIEGPTDYLYFEVLNRRVFKEALDLVAQCVGGVTPASGKKQTIGTDLQKITLGRFGTVPMELIRDDESAGRCFLKAGDSANACIRIQIAGSELKAFAAALAQVTEELNDATAR
jgi:hypothetical protein